MTDRQRLHAGHVKRVFVDRLAIDRNRREERDDPPLMVRTDGKVGLAHEVEILDRHGDVVARIVHDPRNPLSEGAHVWVETRAAVRLRDEHS